MDSSNDQEGSGNTPTASDKSNVAQNPEASATEFASADVQEPSKLTSRGPFRSGIIAFVFSLLVVAVLNWPYQYTVLKTSAVGSFTSPVDFELVADEPPVMAGFPYRYLISFPDQAAHTQNRLFSLTALLWNAGISLLPILLVTFYFYRRAVRAARMGQGSSGSRQTKNKKTKNKNTGGDQTEQNETAQTDAEQGKAPRRRGAPLSIADLLVVTMLLAIPLGVWQRTSAIDKTEKEFAQRIRRADGGAQLVAWAPRLIAEFIPASYKKLLNRIQIVRIESPPDKLLAEVVSHKGLTCLRIGGDEYDLKTLEPIFGSPFITDLRVAGRALDTKTVQGITACPRLHTLNWMRTNVNDQTLSLLSFSKHLRRLCLVHTDVKLSELGIPSWSESIEQLWLPHPDSGQQDSLVIDGWPKLRRVVITELDTLANAGEMKVSLTNLPQLDELELDVFQKFNLTLKNLPKLAKIHEAAFQWRSRIPRGGTAPGNLWYSHLVMENLPEFSNDILFYGVDLESLRLRGIPKVKMLGAGAFFRTVSQPTYARKLSQKTSSALISGIGDSEGPPLVDLDAVPLANVDLSPLKNNQQLNQIMLSHSQTNLSQWKKLKGMDRLKRLDVKGNEMNSEAMSWILDSFPNLEHFAFSSSNAMLFRGEGLSLEVVDRPNLKVLDFGDSNTAFFNKVRVVNSPNLALNLDIGYVQELELVNANSIQGLSVDGPLPRKLKMQGLTGLTYLALGGPEVNDEVIASIRECKNLRALTLAYPSASAESLKTLPMSKIQSLYMPGADVDDSVVQAWGKMEQLTQLDLRDTKITGKSLPQLLGNHYAMVVRLDRTDVTSADLSLLADKTDLEHLTLAGIGIEPDTLSEALSNGLNRLDLSDTKLVPGIYKVLQSSGNSLSQLVLKDCEFDSSAIQQIASQNRSIVWDLTGSNATTRLQSMLLSAGRYLDEQEFEQNEMINRMNDAGQMPKPRSLIDLAYFAPDNNPMPTQVNPVAGPSLQIIPPQAKKAGSWLADVFSLSSDQKAGDDADSTENQTDENQRQTTDSNEPDPNEPDSSEQDQ